MKKFALALISFFTPFTPPIFPGKDDVSSFNTYALLSTLDEDGNYTEPEAAPSKPQSSTKKGLQPKVAHHSHYGETVSLEAGEFGYTISPYFPCLHVTMLTPPQLCDGQQTIIVDQNLAMAITNHIFEDYGQDPFCTPIIDIDKRVKNGLAPSLFKHQKSKGEFVCNLESKNLHHALTYPIILKVLMNGTAFHSYSLGGRECIIVAYDVELQCPEIGFMYGFRRFNTIFIAFGKDAKGTDAADTVSTIFHASMHPINVLKKYPKEYYRPVQAQLFYDGDKLRIKYADL